MVGVAQHVFGQKERFQIRIIRDWILSAMMNRLINQRLDTSELGCHLAALIARDGIGNRENLIC